MAEIIQTGKKSHSTARRIHLDMTPMVDLAFLLVTFFVLTSSMIKPKTMEIIYPQNEGEPMRVKNAITLLLSEQYPPTWYAGEFDQQNGVLNSTDFTPSGLRKVLLEQNHKAIEAYVIWKQQHPDTKDDHPLAQEAYQTITSSRTAPMVIVKTTPTTPYAHVIAALDELNIAHVRKRVVQPMSHEEELWLESKFVE